MKELSLHIIDMVQNAVQADASLIQILIKEDSLQDTFVIEIIDDGCGISEERLPYVTDPFETSRTTRRVGLGLPLFKAAAERCNGSFTVESDSRGTKVVATFQHSHIDRAPLGHMEETLLTAVLSLQDQMNLVYRHEYNGKAFTFDTREMRKVLGEEIPLNSIDVLNWIKEALKEGLIEIKD